MKLEKSVLLAALQAADKVAQKSVLPITSHVLLSPEPEEGRLDLAVTDLSLSLELTISAQEVTEGGLCLPVGLFKDVVESFPEGEVELWFEPLAGSLTLKSGRTCSSLKGLASEEFPAMPQLKDSEQLISLPAAKLKEAIGQVAFAASSDSARPVLTCVSLKLEPGLVELAAADGIRLVVRRIPVNTQQKTQLLIPARSLEGLARLLKGGEHTEVELRVAKNRSQVMFLAPNFTLSSSLVEGQFPDYRRIVPERATTCLKVSGAELGRAVRLTGYFCGQNLKAARLTLKPGRNELEAGSLVLEAVSNPETGSSQAVLDADIRGPEMTVGINLPLLQDFLKLTEENLELELQHSGAALKFSLSGRPEWVGVLMPLHLG